MNAEAEDLFRLLPLGTGSILMPGGRSAASYHVRRGDRALQIDLGPGSLLRMRQAGLEAWRIREVLLSHFHLDHHLDLWALLFLRRSPELRSGLLPLTVYGPPGLSELRRRMETVYGDWIDAPLTEWKEVSPGETEAGGFRIELRRANHPQPAYCLRLESGGKVLAYSGDGGYGPSLVEVCRGADFAVLECSFPDASAVEGHLHPEALLRILAEAGPKRIGLSHLYPGMVRELEERGLEGLFPERASRFVLLEDLVEVRLE